MFQFKENNVTLKKIIHLLQYIYVLPLRYSENFKQSYHWTDVAMLDLKLRSSLLREVNNLRG